jgi:hypothetical protein
MQIAAERRDIRMEALDTEARALVGRLNNLQEIFRVQGEILSFSAYPTSEGLLISLPSLVKSLAPFRNNSLPDLVDCLLKFRAGLYALFVQISLGSFTHDNYVLLSHASHDRVGV